MIKHSARPSYWVPDCDAQQCFICEIPFGTAEELVIANTNTPQILSTEGENRRHHCRKCGKGVCNNCSKNQMPVPERGWIDSVRVCDACISDYSNFTSKTLNINSDNSKQT